MDAATVKCHQCRFWLVKPKGEWGVCKLGSAKPEGMQFRAVLETAPEFGCERGVAGDPNLPDGWDLDKLAGVVRGTRRGSMRIPDMLVLLRIVENQEDGKLLSKKKGIHLNRSLVSAGWTQTKKESGRPWFPPPA